MVTGALRTVYRYWTLIVALLLVVQIALAGYGAFDTVSAAEGGTASEDQVEDSFGLHVGLGHTLVPLSFILLFLFALGGRLGRNRVLLSLAPFALWFVQVFLAAGGE